MLSRFAWFFSVFGLERLDFQKLQVPPFYVNTSVEIYLLTVQILLIGVLQNTP